MMTGAPRIGVVLSSGGARGVYAHTGFLLALEEMGIPVSACAGCSAGAVVGGIAASGTDLRAWSETLAHLDTARFWTPDPWPRLAWQLAVRRGRGFVGLSGTEAAVEFCRSQLAVPRFEACRYPFHTLAVSLGSMHGGRRDSHMPATPPAAEANRSALDLLDEEYVREKSRAKNTCASAKT